MYDAVYRSDAPALQRARGEVHVRLRRRHDATVLAGLRQAGCLKARFPREAGDGWRAVVTLNSSGGVAAGDRLDNRFAVEEGARATIAAQAAERIYRALPGAAPSVLRTRIDVASGAALEWLPQETILFDRAALDRRLDVSVAPDGWFLGVEALVFGRAAMGETVDQGLVHDLIRVERAGRLLLHDALRLEGEIAALLRRKAIAAGARAVATLVHVAPDAEARLDGVRAALEGSDSGASAWDGMLLARILAPDGASLRRTVMAVLTALRDARPLPRVWLC